MQVGNRPSRVGAHQTSDTRLGCNRPCKGRCYSPSAVSQIWLFGSREAGHSGISAAFPNSREGSGSLYGQSFQKEPGASLEFAAAAAELLWIRVKEATDELPLSSSPVDPTLDLYPWLTVVTPCDLSHFDRHGFRALICGIRYVAGAKTLLAVSKAPSSSYGLRITISNHTWSMRNAAARTLLEGLSAWSNAHVFVLSDDTLTMEPHNVD